MARAAKPPTTPPAIAPALDLDDVVGGVVFVGEDVGELVLVETPRPVVALDEAVEDEDVIGSIEAVNVARTTCCATLAVPTKPVKLISWLRTVKLWPSQNQPLY
jgi:hypothetical protein